VIVVKVGGSLYDHPRLGSGLSDYLTSLAPASVLLVPGGGDMADAVRQLDRIHGLGEETAHWLALRSLDVTAAFLRQVLHSDRQYTILDCFAFAREDDQRLGALPHSWAVTTDSLAARVAHVYGAERLVLLKSVDVPLGTPWEVAAELGWVDAHFPKVAAELRCPIHVINFRRVLETATG
jgi:aspartokinase-like uncharacterized kinase